MSWAEVRRGGESWRGGKRWEELRLAETSSEELRRGGQRWEELRRAGKKKSWAEVGRDETNFESCWKELRKLRRAEMAWEELRNGGHNHNWKGVRQSDDEFTEQSLEAVRVRCISYGQTLSLDPIALHFLNLKTSATRLARVLLVYSFHFSYIVYYYVYSFVFCVFTYCTCFWICGFCYIWYYDIIS